MLWGLVLLCSNVAWQPVRGVSPGIFTSATKLQNEGELDMSPGILTSATKTKNEVASQLISRPLGERAHGVSGEAGNTFSKRIAERQQSPEWRQLEELGVPDILGQPLGEPSSVQPHTQAAAETHGSQRMGEPRSVRPHSQPPPASPVAPSPAVESLPEAPGSGGPGPQPATPGSQQEAWQPSQPPWMKPKSQAEANPKGPWEFSRNGGSKASAPAPRDQPKGWTAAEPPWNWGGSNGTGRDRNTKNREEEGWTPETPRGWPYEGEKAPPGVPESEASPEAKATGWKGSTPRGWPYEDPVKKPYEATSDWEPPRTPKEDGWTGASPKGWPFEAGKSEDPPPPWEGHGPSKSEGWKVKDPPEWVPGGSKTDERPEATVTEPNGWPFDEKQKQLDGPKGPPPDWEPPQKPQAGGWKPVEPAWPWQQRGPRSQRDQEVPPPWEGYGPSKSEGWKVDQPKWGPSAKEPESEKTGPKVPWEFSRADGSQPASSAPGGQGDDHKADKPPAPGGQGDDRKADEPRWASPRSKPADSSGWKESAPPWTRSARESAGARQPPPPESKGWTVDEPRWLRRPADRKGPRPGPQKEETPRPWEFSKSDSKPAQQGGWKATEPQWVGSSPKAGWTTSKPRWLAKLLQFFSGWPAPWWSSGSPRGWGFLQMMPKLEAVPIARGVHMPPIPKTPAGAVWMTTDSSSISSGA